ncbi:MAG: hypothetical protein ACXAB5_01740 [Candidatus Thorarchaeota archaeon]|jgi:hypothetical protein
MMIQFLEFTVIQASILAIALPIVAVCLFILIIPSLRNGSANKLRRYLSYLVKPPVIDAYNSVSPEDDTEQERVSLWREDKVRLFFYYLGIGLFLISFIIGEFYEVMFDLLIPISQGSTGVVRTATSVIFQSPFSAGWIGALPWSGQITYHETWTWIFFTAPLSDNPHFFETLIIAMLLISIGVGLVFLSPLAIKTIRQSFLPSMFFFMTGMTIFSKVTIGCLAETMALAFRNVQLQYMHIIVTGDMIPNLMELVAIGFLMNLGMFALFLVLGRKLWRVHYTDSKSRTWFMVYVALSFWLGLALTMMVV